MLTKTQLEGLVAKTYYCILERLPNEYTRNGKLFAILERTIIFPRGDYQFSEISAYNVLFCFLKVYICDFLFIIAEAFSFVLLFLC